MKIFTVRTLDVWGNLKDGYEVNDSFPVKDIAIENDTDKAILKALIESGFLKSECTLQDINIDGDNDLINIECSEGMPLYILELVE